MAKANSTSARTVATDGALNVIAAPRGDCIFDVYVAHKRTSPYQPASARARIGLYSRRAGSWSTENVASKHFERQGTRHAVALAIYTTLDTSKTQAGTKK